MEAWELALYFHIVLFFQQDRLLKIQLMETKIKLSTPSEVRGQTNSIVLNRYLYNWKIWEKEVSNEVSHDGVKPLIRQTWTGGWGRPLFYLHRPTALLAWPVERPYQVTPHFLTSFSQRFQFCHYFFSTIPFLIDLFFGWCEP